MDPKVALIAMLEALTDRDTTTAQEYFDGLRHWIDSGGFIPSELPVAIEAARLTCGADRSTD